MLPDGHSKQIKLLIADVERADAEHDIEGGLFALWQICQLCRAYNRTRPPPDPKKLKMLDDMVRAHGIDEEGERILIDELNRRFGGEPL